MSELPVYNIEGREVGKFELDEDLFDGKVNRALLHQVVVMYLARQRRGCASTKTRGDVSGGGKKPWRQKGTGRARFGSTRNPVWKGGGVAFGPKPKDYSYELPKKIKVQAVKSSLNSKVETAEFSLIDGLELKDGKTKNFVKVLTAIKATDKPLILIEKFDENIKRASRNVKGTTVLRADDVNAHDILKHNRLVMTTKAVEILAERVLSKK